VIKCSKKILCYFCLLSNQYYLFIVLVVVVVYPNCSFASVHRLFSCYRKSRGFFLLLLLPNKADLLFKLHVPNFCFILLPFIYNTIYCSIANKFYSIK
jgi:hypothetical protein